MFSLSVLSRDQSFLWIYSWCGRVLLGKILPLTAVIKIHFYNVLCWQHFPGRDHSQLTHTIQDKYQFPGTIARAHVMSRFIWSLYASPLSRTSHWHVIARCRLVLVGIKHGLPSTCYFSPISWHLTNRKTDIKLLLVWHRDVLVTGKGTNVLKPSSHT